MADDNPDKQAYQDSFGEEIILEQPMYSPDSLCRWPGWPSARGFARGGAAQTASPGSGFGASNRRFAIGETATIAWTQKPHDKTKIQSQNSSMAKSNEIIFEKIDWKKFSPGPVVGVDEVGRGCLAGPVYAAAVCLKDDSVVAALTDSKLLSEKKREELMPLILSHHWVGVGFATVEEIDSINILQASLLAMKRAVGNLEIAMGCPTGHLLVDGNMKVPGLTMKQTTLVKGDLRCAPISAASIVAKVTRDRLMKDLGREFPSYGFEGHKGYAAPTHKKAIEAVGPCIHHRRSFAGVKEHLARLIL
jgi:ribonuclease HII